MPYTVNAVVLEAFSMEYFTFTRYISGTVTAADVGKAVTLDTAAAGTVKLAAATDAIYGRIYSFEDRLQEGVKVVAVERKFVKRMPKTAAAIAVGDHVVGGTGGLVQTGAVSLTNERNTVLAVDTTVSAGFPNGFAIVEKL